MSTTQIGSGASLGREGPTVQICAGIASLVGRAAALSRENLRRLLPVGSAAGVAAAFNAPIAAVTFTLEEIVGDLNHTVLAGVVVAAAVAAAVERLILGEHPVFDVPAGYGFDHAESLLLYALLGLLAAVMGVAFTRSLLRLRSAFTSLRHVPVWARPAVGGLVTGVLAVAALAFLDTGGITGGGYDALGEALRGGLPFRALVALGAMKLVATSFSYGSGGAGGIFAPTLFMGGMLGGAVGVLDVELFNHTDGEVGAFALVGMGAMFAAAVRAPMTSVLIIFEMTGSYRLILPLMISNMVAYGLARRWQRLPVYEALLDQDGIELPHPGRPAPHVLEQLRVGEVMTSGPVTVEADEPAAAALEHLRDHPFSTFPVVDERGSLVGLVSEGKLRRTVASGGGDEPVRGLAGRRARLTPDQPLLQAVVLMDKHRTRQLAVVDPHDPRRLIGVLALTDVVREQARALRAQAGTDVSEQMLETVPSPREAG